MTMNVTDKTVNLVGQLLELFVQLSHDNQRLVSFHHNFQNYFKTYAQIQSKNIQNSNETDGNIGSVKNMMDLYTKHWENVHSHQYFNNGLDIQHLLDSTKLDPNQVFKKTQALLVKISTDMNFRQDFTAKLICNPPKVGSDNIFFSTTTQSNDGSKFQCRYCTESFDLNNELIAHLNTHHHSRLICFNCDETFSSEYLFKKHCKKNCQTKNDDSQQSSISGNYNLFVCLFCPLTFSERFLLLSHINDAHINLLLTENDKQQANADEEIAEHETDQTVPVPSTSAGVHSDLPSKTGRKSKKNRCRKCLRVFFTKSSLHHHQQRYPCADADIAPYRCRLCQHCFQQKLHFAQHFRDHLLKKPLNIDQNNGTSL